MAQITYTNKVALNENPEIANINKVTDDDMNEIKSVVNANYNNTIQITNTEPTDSDNKLWIDTGEIGIAASEITNEYSTSTGKGYSCNYINGVVLYDNLTGSNGNGIVLSDTYSNYRMIEIFYRDSNYCYSSIKVPIYLETNEDVIISSYYPSSTQLIINSTHYVLSAANLGIRGTTDKYIYTINFDGTTNSVSQSNGIYILKVIGYE